MRAKVIEYNLKIKNSTNHFEDETHARFSTFKEPRGIVNWNKLKRIYRMQKALGKPFELEADSNEKQPKKSSRNDISRC